MLELVITSLFMKTGWSGRVEEVLSIFKGKQGNQSLHTRKF